MISMLIFFRTIFITFLFSPTFFYAQDINSEGREFYVVFPLNDTNGIYTPNFAIYISSKTDTQVKVKRNDISTDYNFTVKAGELYTFSKDIDRMDSDIELTKYEEISNRSLKVSSVEPISVFVFNNKAATAEGFKVIPTEYWGEEYIHNCYYDFKDRLEWGSGFNVIAKEDQTEVSILIRDGANGTTGFGKTVNGRVHGDSIYVVLNEGEVYTVQGSGETRGVFDISGSIISSNKPVGVVSYHNRVSIPISIDKKQGDYLVEMMPPIDTWGRKYISLDLNRENDKGDYFRILAGEDNTTFSVKWYDRSGNGNNKMINSVESITLKNKGDWYEYIDSKDIDQNQESIKGVAVFEADKPILVHQYTYRGNYHFGLFMTTLPAIEQYVNSAVFVSPPNIIIRETSRSTLTLFAIGDSSDIMKNTELLSSIIIGDLQVSYTYPDFLTSRIPCTNIYWTDVAIGGRGTMTITANTKFGAHLHGYASYSSYGWPAAVNYKKIHDPQSSVEISDIVDQFEAKLISENPTNNDELRIRVSSRIEENAKFYITDINGKIVKELGEKSIIGEKEFSFNISDLVSGVYFITISANGMNQIIEFIVTR